MKIAIDRSKPLDLDFLDYECATHEEDVRLKEMTELDLDMIEIVHVLQGSKEVITGEEKLRRLKETKCLPLGIDAFQTLYDNRQILPKPWRQKINGLETKIFFEGTVLISKVTGDRIVPCLVYFGGAWLRNYYLLRDKFGPEKPSAVILTK